MLQFVLAPRFLGIAVGHFVPRQGSSILVRAMTRSAQLGLAQLAEALIPQGTLLAVLGVY